MNYDIFISYSSQDSDVAQSVCKTIEDSGKQCWIAPRDITPGTEWAEGILSGIAQCRVMVLIFSSNANISPQIKREVERAVSRSMPILPFKIDPTLPSGSFEYFIMNSHWLDATVPPVESHFQNLVQSLDCLLAPEQKNETRSRDEWSNSISKPKPNNIPLPSLGSLFKGREAILTGLREQLQEPLHGSSNSPKPIAIFGAGGIGKTRLAVEYAWLYKSEYVALLFLAADTPMVFELELANLATVLGIDLDAGATEAVKQRAVLNWLQTQAKWLLIVDSVDTDESVLALRKNLAQLSLGDVIITTRISKWSAGVEELELGILDTEDAVSYLQEAAIGRHRTIDDSEQAEKVARQVGQMALGLEHAAAFVKAEEISFGEYLRLWEEDESSILNQFDLSLIEYPRELLITWKLSLDRLGDDAVEMLEIMSWFSATPIPESLLEALPKQSCTDAPKNLFESFTRVCRQFFYRNKTVKNPKESLKILARYCLIQRRRSRGFREVYLHRLVQATTRHHQRENDKIRGNSVSLNLVHAVDLLNDRFIGDATDLNWLAKCETLLQHISSVCNFVLELDSNVRVAANNRHLAFPNPKRRSARSEASVAKSELRSLKSQFRLQEKALGLHQKAQSFHSTTLNLLKIDRRVANVNVIETDVDNNRGPSMLVRFSEVNRNGETGSPRDFVLSGETIYIDVLHVCIARGFPSRVLSTAIICSFTKIYGDRDNPKYAERLDVKTTEHTGPGIYCTDFPSEIEKRIWRDFWTIADDPVLQNKLGLKACAVQTISTRADPGCMYQVTLRVNGQIGLVPVSKMAAD